MRPWKSRAFLQARENTTLYLILALATGVVWDCQLWCAAHISTPQLQYDELDLVRYPVGYRIFRTREIIIARANRLIALGRVEEAEVVCEEILKDWNSHPGCLLVHSHVHLARGDHAKARQAIRDSIDNDPENTASRDLLARLLVHQAADYFRNGDVEAAYEGYRQIVLMDMNEFKIATDVLAEVYFNMGKVLQGLGMAEEAIAHFEAVTRLDSYNLRAFAAIVDLMISRQDGTDEQVIHAVKSALKSKGMDDASGIWSMLLKVQLERCEWSTRHHDADRLMAQLKSSASGGTCEMSPLLMLQLLLPASFAVDCAAANSVRVQAHLHAPSTYIAAWGSNVTEQRSLESGQSNPDSANQGRPVQRALRIGFVSGLGFGKSTSAGSLLLGPAGWLGSRLHKQEHELWIAACISLAHDLSVNQLKVLGCDEVYLIAEDSDVPSAAAVVKSAAVDIAICVGGAEDEFGISVMSLKIAHLQVVWLGIEISSGSSFIQLMVTDKIMSPPDLAGQYTEHFIYLPVSSLTPSPGVPAEQLEPPVLESYQKIYTSVTSRQEGGGLHPEVLTLGVLGPASSIDPDIWAVWMEVLRSNRRSQLLLISGASDHVLKNLQYQAEQSGIVSRQIVASDSDLPAALKLADLILDTRALNANGADLLAAVSNGVPILSLPGDCPCRRTSASLLFGHKAAGFSIIRNLEDYEETGTRLVKVLQQPSNCTKNSKCGLFVSCKKHSASKDISTAQEHGSGKATVLYRAWTLAWEVAGMQENRRFPQKYHIIVSFDK